MTTRCWQLVLLALAAVTNEMLAGEARAARADRFTGGLRQVAITVQLQRTSIELHCCVLKLLRLSVYRSADEDETNDDRKDISASGAYGPPPAKRS